MDAGTKKRVEELTNRIGQSLKDALAGYVGQTNTEEVRKAMSLALNQTLKGEFSDVDVSGLYVVDSDPKDPSRMKVFVNPGRLLQIWTNMSRTNRIRYRDYFEYVFGGPLKLDFDPLKDDQKPT